MLSKRPDHVSLIGLPGRPGGGGGRRAVDVISGVSVSRSEQVGGQRAAHRVSGEHLEGGGKSRCE